MPLYEYRPKSGDCDICGGCFVDLQKMSDPAHTSCPDCGKACERVLSAPIVSVRGAEYRAAANAEKRGEAVARARGENAAMRESTLKKLGQLAGHTHNCALAGCHGAAAQTEAQKAVQQGATDDGSAESRARRFGGLPHLVGSGKKS